jgi:EAL domain-containing protein (putative c-di-GMP-specific phosphodiesterase class I)
MLREGDILHFGTCEFRLKRNVPTPVAGPAPGIFEQTLYVGRDASLPENFPVAETEFLEMLDMAWLRVAWQPIVHFAGRGIAAYEVLGRGSHPGLPESPVRLFDLAATMNKEVALSEAFRCAAARVAAGRGEKVRLFMNSHPKEMFTEALYRSIEHIQRIAPNMELVMEVHETAVADVHRMKAMAGRLRDLGVMLAYDDFGAGQARFNELAEIPADVVKFDMSLVRDLHRASQNKQQLVARLVRLVKDLGSAALAEGVESEDEAQVCMQMGFDLCQGFLTGRPEIV